MHRMFLRSESEQPLAVALTNAWGSARALRPERPGKARGWERARKSGTMVE